MDRHFNLNVSRRQKKTKRMKEKPPKNGHKRKMDAGHELHPKRPLAKKKKVVEDEQRLCREASSAQPTNHLDKENFESRYSVGELLGEGGYGSVYAGVRMADGKKVAIKYVAKSTSVRFLTLPGETAKLPLEVALMQLVSKLPSCKYVLELLEWIEMPTCYILILERPDPCLDLFEFCKSIPQDESVAQLIMMQVFLAVHHCHERGVFHRDIKPENILINPDTMDVKLIDFGCGDLLKDRPYREFRGTELYIPPEWFLEGQYQGLPATIWSLGILLFVLVCGEFPFNSRQEIVDGNIDFRHGVSEACEHLIKWCLHEDPNERPTIEQILQHKWCSGLQP